MSSLLPINLTVPLIIDGGDVIEFESNCLYRYDDYKENYVEVWRFQGTDISSCRVAVESSAKVYSAWAAPAPAKRRRLFLKLAQVNYTWVHLVRPER